MTPQDANKNTAAFLSLFIILAAGIAFVGHRYYLGHKNEIETRIRHELAAIADEKVRQLAAWRAERLADGQIIRASSTVVPALVQVLKGRATANGRQSVLAWIDTVEKHPGYEEITLVDSEGTYLLSLPKGVKLPPRLLAEVRTAMRTQQTIISDMHAGEGSRNVCMALVVPLSGPDGACRGAFLLWLDPRRFLYPMIQSWPTPSRSAETLLVARDGDHVVYLNELRHRKGTALTLRRPLAESTLPAANVVLGQEGISDGIDYRGVPVLAATRRVPDSSWCLVAKVDAEEIRAPLRDRARVVTLVVGLLIAAVGMAGGLLRRQERRQSAEALRTSDARLARAQRTARLGNWEVEFRKWPAEAGDDVVWWSEETYLIFGVKPGSFTPSRKAVLACLEPAERRAAWAAFQKALAMGAAYQNEHRVRRPDGSVRHVRAHAEIVRDKTGRPIRMTGTVQDITEYKRLEEQFLQAQKLESLGRLAGGVAHDFNNLLTVINGYTELALADAPPGSPAYTNLNEVRKAGEQAAALTSQLLAFSRRQVARQQTLNLSVLARDVEDMLRRLIGGEIELVTELSPSLWPVLADPGQIQQVIMNLVVNARDALPRGGRIVIKTVNVDLDESSAEGMGIPTPGPHVLLVVSDNGTGMDEQTKGRLFEPFFTTKEKGKGTGLGLATVYGIVQQSRGWIRIQSEPGQGSTFTVYLPRAAA